MEAEVLSQPGVWKECLDALSGDGTVTDIRAQVSRESEWLFTGCGSSYYIAQSAAAFFTELGLHARALPASELLLFPQTSVDRHAPDLIPVLISRSGRTSEVLQAAERLRNKSSPCTVAITCNAREPLERLASFTLHALAASEQSTVMTRSFSSMLLLLQYLGTVVVGERALGEVLMALPDAFAPSLPGMHSAVQEFVAAHDFSDYVFLAQGPLFSIAQECALKVTECSSSYAQTFHTLEFRHGPKSIIAPQVLTVFLLSDSGYEAEIGMLEEVKSLGGTTMVIANRADERVRKSADLLVELKLSIPEPAMPIAYAPCGQLLGLFTGLKKGLDPDNPRHLSRVVVLDSAV